MTIALYEHTDLCACCSDLISLCADDHEHDGPIFRVGDLEYLCGPQCIAKYLLEDRTRALEVLVIATAVLDWYTANRSLDEADQAGLNAITETAFHAAAQLQSDAQCRAA